MSSTAENGKEHTLHVTVVHNYSKEPPSKGPKETKEARDAKLLKPFSYGFKRELVLRAPSEGSTARKEADAYYYYKDGVKMRSKPEVVSYLSKHPEIPLTGENFSFCKRSIYKPPDEVVRHAKMIAKPIAKSMARASRMSSESPKITVIRPRLEPDQVWVVRRLSSEDDASDSSEPSAAKKSKTSEVTTNGTHANLDLTSVLVPVVTLTSNDTSGEPSEVDMEAKGDEEEERPDDVPATRLSDTPPGGEPKKCEAMYDVLRSPTDGPAGGSSSGSSGARNVVKTYSKAQPTVPSQEKKHKQIAPAILRARNKIAPANPIQSRTGAALELCNLRCPQAKGRMPTLQCSQCLCLYHPACVGVSSANAATPGEAPFVCRACASTPSLSEKPAKAAAAPFSLPPSLQKPPCPNVTVIAARPEKDDSRRTPIFRIRSSATDTRASTASSKANDAAQVPNSTSPASATMATTATGRDGGPLPVIKFRAPTPDSAVSMLLSLVQELNGKSKIPPSTPRTAVADPGLTSLEQSTDCRTASTPTTVDQKSGQKSQTICTNHNAGSGSVVSTSSSPLPKPVFRVDLFTSLSKDGAKEIPKDSTAENRVVTNGTYFPENTGGAAKKCRENYDARRTADEASSDEDGLAIDVGRRRSSSADSTGSLSPKSFSLTDVTLSDLLADCCSSSMPNAVWSRDDTQTSTEVGPNAGDGTAPQSSRDLENTVCSGSADSKTPVSIFDPSPCGPEQDFRATRTLRDLLERRDIDAGESRTERRCGSTSVRDSEADTGLEAKCGRGGNSTGQAKGVERSGVWVQFPGSATVIEGGTEFGVEDGTPALQTKEKCETTNGFMASVECFTTGYRVLDLIFRRLPIPTLCRAAQVCTAWNCLAKQMHLWEHLDLTMVLVKDWDRCVAVLDRMRSHTLTADGTMWRHLAKSMQRLRGVRHLRLKDVSPADLLLWTNIFSQIASLRATVMCYSPSTTTRMSTSLQRPAELRLEGFGTLASLRELALEAPAGMRLLQPIPLATNPLGKLRRLSLKKVMEKFPAESFLSSMKELEELEYGSCRSWTIRCFRAVGRLDRLRSLTLIDGGCQEGLSDALIKLKRLEMLRLKRWKFTESLDPVLRQLPNLKELELPLEASQGDGRSNLNALLSCLNLSALKCLSWTVTCHHLRGLPMIWWREERPPSPFLDAIRIPIQGKTCSCAWGRRTSCCDASRKVGRIVGVSSNPKEGITLLELSEGLRRTLRRVDVVVCVDFPT